MITTNKIEQVLQDLESCPGYNMHKEAIELFKKILDEAINSKVIASTFIVVKSPKITEET